MVGIVAKDVLLLLAFALQGAHAPTAETEGVSVDAPGTFVIGNRDNDGRMSLIEMVKPPETVDNWSELISVSTVIARHRRQHPQSDLPNLARWVSRDLPRAERDADERHSRREACD